MKLVEHILYSGFGPERDLLDLKLAEHAPYVDQWIVTEATTTFSGRSKELTFPTELIQKYGIGRLIYNPITELQVHPTDRWAAERDQRSRGLFTASLTDTEDVIFMDTCVDEIFRPHTFQRVKEVCQTGQPCTFWMDLHLYYIDYRQTNSWRWAVAAPLSWYKDNDVQEAHWRRMNFFSLWDAGWHFSSLGGKAQVIEKLSNFAHSEFDNEAHHNELDKNMAEGIPFWDVNAARLEQVPWSPEFFSSLPTYMQQNLEKYLKYFRPIKFHV